jgi:CBS domain-containing protein
MTVQKMHLLLRPVPEFLSQLGSRKLIFPITAQPETRVRDLLENLLGTNYLRSLTTATFITSQVPMTHFFPLLRRRSSTAGRSHRAYVIDDQQRPIAVISYTDVLSKIMP